jgi:hypothetical protein
VQAILVGRPLQVVVGRPAVFQLAMEVRSDAVAQQRQDAGAAGKDDRLALQPLDRLDRLVERGARSDHEGRQVLLEPRPVVEQLERVLEQVRAAIAQHDPFVLDEADRDRQQRQLLAEFLVGLVEGERGIVPEGVGAVDQAEAAAAHRPMDVFGQRLGLVAEGEMQALAALLHAVEHRGPVMQVQRVEQEFREFLRHDEVADVHLLEQRRHVEAEADAVDDEEARVGRRQGRDLVELAALEEVEQRCRDVVVMVRALRPQVMDRRVHEEAVRARAEFGQLPLGMALRVDRIEQGVAEVDVDVAGLDAADDPPGRVRDRAHAQVKARVEPLQRLHVALEQVVGLGCHGAAVTGRWAS